MNENVSARVPTVPQTQLAPIALFAYARVDHLRQTVESLRANPEAPLSHIVIYCDAAKSPEHQQHVDAVRRYVETVNGFSSVRTVLQDRNLGLAQSVISGVSQMVDDYGKVIVLEDDLVVSPHFLNYMNDALDRYEHDERVASIHAYSYPVDEPLPETFFLRGADCWGWATWSRAWTHFEDDGEKLLKELRAKGLSWDFDFDGRYPYAAMLEDRIAGRNSSWAILWYAACYLKGLLTLYPGRSLVENIGNDSSGTHGGNTKAMSRAPADAPVHVKDVPIETSAIARRAFVRFFQQQHSWSNRLRYLLRTAARAFV